MVNIRKLKYIVLIPQRVLSHRVTKTRLVIKKERTKTKQKDKTKQKKLQAVVDLIMRLKLPHTLLGRTN